MIIDNSRSCHNTEKNVYLKIIKDCSMGLITVTLPQCGLSGWRHRSNSVIAQKEKVC